MGQVDGFMKFNREMPKSRDPNERLKDVILFDPPDSEFPIGFNILQANSELEKNLLSSDLVATFRRMATSWGDVMDSVLSRTATRARGTA